MRSQFETIFAQRSLQVASPSPLPLAGVSPIFSNIAEKPGISRGKIGVNRLQRARESTVIYVGSDPKIIRARGRRRRRRRRRADRTTSTKTMRDKRDAAKRIDCWRAIADCDSKYPREIGNKQTVFPGRASDIRRTLRRTVMRSGVTPAGFNIPRNRTHSSMSRGCVVRVSQKRREYFGRIRGRFVSKVISKTARPVD